jgi:hypothetical protein
MEVLKRLPSSLELNPTRSIHGEGDKLFLSVACTHTVSAKLSEEYRDSSGTVTYVMQADKTVSKICENLHVSKTMAPLVMQQSEDVKAIIDAVRPKTGYDISAYVGQYFDMRALAYTLGAIFGASSWGTMPNPVPPEMPISRSIANVWRNPNSGDILLPPTFTDSASEWVSFCCIAGWAKARAVVYLSDTVPPGGTVFTGHSMASFALKVYAWVLASADSLCVADHHEMAFWRGLSSVITLHGHSDEAGWIRGALECADYPRPQGFLFTTVASKIGLATDSRVANSEVLRWQVALTLKYAAVFSMVDATDGGLPTILKVGDGNGVPSDVDGLYNIYEHLSRWRTAIGKMDGHMPSSVGDVASLRTYFTVDAADRHFKPGSYMCPYFWVEPSVIISGAAIGSWQPCDPEKTTHLPFFDKMTGVYKKALYREVNHMALKGQELMVKVDRYIPRRNGASYLLSGSYDRRDGLALFAPVADARLGCLYKDLAHAPATMTDMANARWATPHNCMPHPLEGFTTLPLAMKYSTRGARCYPNFKDLSDNVDVVSECGPLYVVVHTGLKVASVSNHVPPHLRVTLEILRRDGITSVDDEDWLYEGTPICGPDPGMVAVLREVGDLDGGGLLEDGEEASGRWSRPELATVESSDERVAGAVDTTGGALVRINRDGVGAAETGGVRVHIPPDNEPGVKPSVPKSDERQALNKNGSDH